ncbi:hypothetical protein Q0F98_38535 [Paenibacillus amylolyticus]|nr:hypothetical protein Q0F98_38535 [Paenibacillus amylolyticus]
MTNTKGTVIASSQRTYPSQMGAKHHVEIKAKGDRIQVFLDGYTTATIDVKDSTYRSGSTGIIVKKGDGLLPGYLCDGTEPILQ